MKLKEVRYSIACLVLSVLPAPDSPDIQIAYFLFSSNKFRNVSQATPQEWGGKSVKINELI